MSRKGNRKKSTTADIVFYVIVVLLSLLTLPIARITEHGLDAAAGSRCESLPICSEPFDMFANGKSIDSSLSEAQDKGSMALL